MSDDRTFKDRVTSQGEEAMGKIAQELLDSSVVTSAVAAAFEVRERATRAQQVAMSALNLPSATDLERLTRRLRGVSQRLEGIEDGLDRVEQRIGGIDAASSTNQRLAAIEQRLEQIEGALGERSSATG